VIRGLGTAVRSGYGIVYWLYVRDVILTSLAFKQTRMHVIFCEHLKIFVLLKTCHQDRR